MSESPENYGPKDTSRFQGVVIAAMRAKQLGRGSKPRIEPSPGRHKHTSIAMEEVRRGLINSTQLAASVEPGATQSIEVGTGDASRMLVEGPSPALG